MDYEVVSEINSSMNCNIDTTLFLFFDDWSPQGDQDCCTIKASRPS